MAKSNDDAQTFVPDSETRCCTGSTFYSHRHTWTIKKYRFHTEGKVLRSSTFSASGSDNIKWRIDLYPQGDTENSRDYISIFLHLVTSPWKSVPVEFKLTLLDAGEQEIQQEQYVRTIKRGAGCGYREFVKRDDVMNRCRQLGNDELSVRCDMSVAVQTVNIPIEVPPIPEKTSKRRAADILKEFLKNRSSKDAASTLPTDNERSGVRKEFLKTFSPVLKAIFERDFATTGSSRKEISEMDENTFMEFVRFIYVDEAKAPGSMTKHLLAAIDEYALETLSSTAAPPDALKASPTKPVDEDVSSLVAKAERLQVCGAAANESQFVSACGMPMSEEREENADPHGGGVSKDDENNRLGSLENRQDITREKHHNGEESENDSHTSEFSVLEDC